MIHVEHIAQIVKSNLRPQCREDYKSYMKEYLWVSKQVESTYRHR